MNSSKPCQNGRNNDLKKTTIKKATLSDEYLGVINGWMVM
jgi:hypothetical protein